MMLFFDNVRNGIVVVTNIFLLMLVLVSLMCRTNETTVVCRSKILRVD